MMQQSYFYIRPDIEELILPANEEKRMHLERRLLHGRLPGTSQVYDFSTIMEPYEQPNFLSFRLRIGLVGRTVADADFRLGFLHRGMEKLLEITPFQSLEEQLRHLNPFDPVSTHFCYQLARDHLCGFKTSELAALIWPVYLLEAQRIHRHIEVLSHCCTLLQQVHLRAILSELGNTVSLCADPAQWLDKGEAPKQLMLSIEEEFKNTPSIRKRLNDTGKIAKKVAQSFGVTGPAARAAGIAMDQRIRFPYFAYDALIPNMSVKQEGDAYARLLIRMEEILASCDLMTQAAQKLGSSLNRSPDLDISTFSKGVEIGQLEAPEGLMLLTLVGNGGPTPYRLAIRSPSFALAQAIPEFLRGADIEDITLILASLGMALCEVDK